MPRSARWVAYRRTVRSSTPSRSASVRHGEPPAGLEDLQQGEHPGGGSGSKTFSESGRILSGIHTSVAGMTTYVLVPGFWLGAWAWRPVTEALRAQRPRRLPADASPAWPSGPTWPRPETDLDTHVTDVVNLLRYEDLHDVVLVGHSYGGLVVTAAADRVPGAGRGAGRTSTPARCPTARRRPTSPGRRSGPAARRSCRSTATAGGCRRRPGPSSRPTSGGVDGESLARARRALGAPAVGVGDRSRCR